MTDKTTFPHTIEFDPGEMEQSPWADGVLSEIAAALAAKFGISERDALHSLRTEFRACCERDSARFRAKAAVLPTLIEDGAPELSQAPSSDIDTVTDESASRRVALIDFRRSTKQKV